MKIIITKKIIIISPQDFYGYIYSSRLIEAYKMSKNMFVPIWSM